MTETDQMSRMRGVAQGEGSPGRPPGRPMRQLEFNQAMMDFRHMFPETDDEVIEAVLRANNGMVDATIDQLLTMNIDAELNKEEEEDLPDHVLVSVERDVQQQHHHFLPSSHHSSRKSSRESRATRKLLSSDSQGKSQSKESSEDCPPSYTEAVQSHLTHHHRSSANGRSSRHRNSPTSMNNGLMTRPALGTMQHLLDLGPESAPTAGASPNVPVTSTISKSHHSHHRHHHHGSRSSNHHRRRTDVADSSSHKVRPGRNILSATHQDLDDFPPSRSLRKGSLDDSEINGDGERSPHRWRSSHRQSNTSVKRPAFRNWNPPLLGTLPDDFLRIRPMASPVGRRGGQLQRTMSAVGPERPQFYPVSPTPLPMLEQAPALPVKQKLSSQKPHRSLSFAGHSSQLSGSQRKTQTMQPTGLAQHEFSSDILQERMKENERRRRMTSSDLDPDLAQYLEDERLAIMLQNSEFLQELRGDQMFMATLERDQRSATETERTRIEPPVPESVTPPPVTTDDDPSSFIEGYGDDRHTTLEAFPFSQQLPPPANEDVELRKKLKNMGKASKRQFAALAKRFFLKRKKKSVQQIFKESQAPSMMNLLDEDEDEDQGHFDDISFGEHNTVSEPYNFSQNTQSSTSTAGRNSSRNFDVV